MKKKTLLIIAVTLAVIAVLAATLFVFSIYRSKTNDQTALYNRLSTISADEVQLVHATDWETGERFDFSQAEISELTALLNSILSDDLKEGDGYVNTGLVSVYLVTESGEEYLLKYADDTVYFTFDSETALLYGNRD